MLAPSARENREAFIKHMERYDYDGDYYFFSKDEIENALKVIEQANKGLEIAAGVLLNKAILWQKETLPFSQENLEQAKQLIINTCKALDEKKYPEDIIHPVMHILYHSFPQNELQFELAQSQYSDMARSMIKIEAFGYALSTKSIRAIPKSISNPVLEKAVASYSTIGRTAENNWKTSKNAQLAARFIAKQIAMQEKDPKKLHSIIGDAMQYSQFDEQANNDINEFITALKKNLAEQSVLPANNNASIEMWNKMLLSGNLHEAVKFASSSSNLDMAANALKINYFLTSPLSCYITAPVPPYRIKPYPLQSEESHENELKLSSFICANETRMNVLHDLLIFSSRNCNKHISDRILNRLIDLSPANDAQKQNAKKKVKDEYMVFEHQLRKLALELAPAIHANLKERYL